MNIPVTFIESTHVIPVEVIPAACTHDSVTESTYEEESPRDGSFDFDTRIVSMLICDNCSATKTEADLDWVPAW